LREGGESAAPAAGTDAIKEAIASRAQDKTLRQFMSGLRMCIEVRMRNATVSVPQRPLRISAQG
jgi:hypothetical protein